MASTHHDKHHAYSRDLNIWIDTYDDLFSDFDPRPFSERVISDDFLGELNKLTNERDDFVKVVRFQIPQKNRDEKSEKIIMERLAFDFKRQFAVFSAEVKANYGRGAAMTAAGFLLLACAVLVNAIESQKLWHNFLLIILQPAGWFFVWTGLDRIFFGGKPSKRKRDFYERLAKSKIEFVAI
ncbi:MAG TPA: hypothetical protein VFU15_05645 [Bacteroidia bacterium]|nr:hypothetical protein [Bacteroidia bacterium]